MATSTGVGSTTGPRSRRARASCLRAYRADATDVEIRFTDADGGGCRVEIEHRGWQRLDDRGPERREANGRGWSGLLPTSSRRAARVRAA